MENYGEQKRKQILKGFGVNEDLEKVLAVGQLRGGDPESTSGGSLKTEDVEGQLRSIVEKLMQVHKVDRQVAEVMHKHKVTKEKALKMIKEKEIKKTLPIGTKYTPYKSLDENEDRIENYGDQRRKQILKGFNINEDLEKARSLPIGTKRTYDGSDYIKTAAGWEIQYKRKVGKEEEKKEWSEENKKKLVDSFIGDLKNSETLEAVKKLIKEGEGGQVMTTLATPVKQHYAQSNLNFGRMDDDTGRDIVEKVYAKLAEKKEETKEEKKKYKAPRFNIEFEIRKPVGAIDRKIIVNKKDLTQGQIQALLNKHEEWDSPWTIRGGVTISSDEGYHKYIYEKGYRDILDKYDLNNRHKEFLEQKQD